jgi:hypothetical protein
MGKKANQSSALNMVDFLMAQVGLTREQATATIKTIVQHMQKHPGDPLHKIVTAMFGGKGESTKLN